MVRGSTRAITPMTLLASPVVNRLLLGDNLDLMRAEPDESVQMAYLDPPFNTGRDQTRRTLATTVATNGGGDRTGFGGRRYTTRLLEESSYRDAFDDYLGFLEPRLREVRRLLRPTGTLYFHIDCARGALLQAAAGRAVRPRVLPQRADLGLRLRRKAAPPLAAEARHDPRLRLKRAGDYFFDAEAVDREPYMAPGLVTPEKAARGKRPTDVMWHTIVSPTGREKTGYPTQKPEGLLRRFVQASSRPGDMCMDPFAGSGTLGSVAVGEPRPAVPADGLEPAGGRSCYRTPSQRGRSRATLSSRAALVPATTLPRRGRRPAGRPPDRRALVTLALGYQGSPPAAIPERSAADAIASDQAAAATATATATARPKASARPTKKPKRAAASSP